MTMETHLHERAMRAEARAEAAEKRVAELDAAYDAASGEADHWQARVEQLEAAIHAHLERMAEGGWGQSDRLLSDALEKKGKDADE